MPFISKKDQGDHLTIGKQERIVMEEEMSAFYVYEWRRK